jgi:hypothetical protein
MRAILLKAAALIAPGPTMRWAARKFLTPRSVAPTEDEREMLATATRRELVPDGEARLRALVWGDEGPTVLLHFRILRDPAVLCEVAAFVGNGAPVVAPSGRVHLAVTS